MKINFNEVRGFSDSITLTFNFVKQEFKPLLKTFVFIALPLIFVDLFLKSFAARDTFALLVYPESYLNSSYDPMIRNLMNYVSTMVMYFWISLMGIAYIRVYQDKYAGGIEERVKPGEVWRVMWHNLGKALLWGIIYSVMLVGGFMLLLVPGIYVAVIYVFTLYFIILKNQAIFSGMSSSKELVRGKWWNLFGYLLVLQLIVGALTYVFSIPYVVLTFKTTFTQQMPGDYELTFGLMFATIGQNLLYLISVVGIAVRFFSLVEEKEHTVLLSKIDLIGNNDNQMPESEGLH